MITVYGRATSINVRKVLWLCDELGLTPARAAHTLTEPTEHPLPEILALNPNGLIPVLTDGDLVLWESNTICRYLAARQARTDLLPTDPADRARVEQWMDWQATALNPTWRGAFLGLIRKSPAHQDPQTILDSQVAWNRAMTLLDRQLEKTGAYVSGPGFTLADIVIGVSVHRWQQTPISHTDLPAVAAYFQRLLDRPTFGAHAHPSVP